MNFGLFKHDERGCEPSTCKLGFHPRMCYSSMIYRKCTRRNCRLHHLPRTKGKQEQNQTNQKPSKGKHHQGKPMLSRENQSLHNQQNGTPPVQFTVPQPIPASQPFPDPFLGWETKIATLVKKCLEDMLGQKS